MDDGDKKLKYQEEKKNIITAMHNVAIHTVEMLDDVITDKVLVWAISDLDQTMQAELTYIINMETRMTHVSDSVKRRCEASFYEKKGDLEIDYRIYEVYDELCVSRSLPIDWQADIPSICKVLGKEKGRQKVKTD